MILQGLLLILAIPIGLIISYFSNDELKQGRPYFKMLIIITLSLAILFYKTNKTLELTNLFIAIATTMSYYKSFDKKWTQKRI